MRWMKWIGLIGAALLIVACFSTWVTIPSRNIVVTGISARGTSFGKPGFFNLLMTAVFILLTVIPRIWAKRTNLIITGMNLAWSARNYLLISTCRGGDCPEKHVGLFLLLIASILMLVSSLFPDIEIKEK